jgi:hypothetical protein
MKIFSSEHGGFKTYALLGICETLFSVPVYFQGLTEGLTTQRPILIED